MGGAESLVSIGVLDSDEVMRDASELDETTVAQSDRPRAGIPMRRRTKTVPAEPAHKSAQLTWPGASTPVQRAQERTATKNLDPTGKLDDFAILPKVSEPHLLEVTHGLGLAFTCKSHSSQEALSLIRAKEEVQATLALAVFRKEVEAARMAGLAAPPAPASAVVVGTTATTDRESESILVDIPVMAASQPNFGRSKAVLASRRGRRKGSPA
jgi:hypothetical protein